MTIHVNMVEDTDGDLVDVEYFCSAFCYAITTGEDAFGHAYPSPDETDYDVYCNHCGALMWKGLQTELGDD